MMVHQNVFIFAFLALMSEVLCDCRYKCLDEKRFEMSGLEFDCPGTKKCNKNDVYNDCNPCIYPPLCPEPRYECNSSKPDGVIIGGVELKCPDYYKCNFFKEGDHCAPCVIKQCDNQTDFVCLDDPTHVKVGNVNMICTDGTVCNRNYLPPCNPCISAISDDYYDDFFFNE